MTIKQKRLALLDETAAHFNSKNRSATPNGCFYGGIGCAIGRKIEDKELCAKLDEKWDSEQGSSVGNCAVFRKLPGDLRKLGQSFLRDLQLLHDTDHNWDSKGLTLDGHEAYEAIKKNHIDKASKVR